MRRYLNQFFIVAVLLSLIVTSVFPPQAVSASPLQAPTLTFTMTDSLVNDGAGPTSPDEDGDGKADPEETIEYTAVITNSGADPATGVTFNDLLDINTTLVDGSLNVSPLALDDSYETIGNTLLDVGVSTSDPAVHVTNSSMDSLFDNDTEFLGDSFTLKSVESDTAAPFTTATEQSGTVTVESDGNFSYLPAAGFSGTDNFDYVITDDGPDNILGTADDLTSAGRVIITVTPQRVWYVKNNAAPGGLGRSTDPFDTLGEAQAASLDNDTIYVFQGDGTTAGQNAGITLKDGQRLVGEGVALTVPVSVNGGANPATLHVAGSQPLIDNTSGSGVSVPDVSNVQILGLNIAGSTNAVNVTTTAANSGGFELANNTIRSAGANGIDVNGGGSGILTVSLHDNTVTATGNGIDIQRTAGSVNIIAFDDNVIHGNTSGIGINIVGTGATILFDTNSATATFETVSGGTTFIGQSGNGVGQSGLILNNIRGDLNFSDLDIYADNGTALLVNGTSPNYTGTSGTRVVANSNTPLLSATGGPAANLTDVSVNLVLSSLSSANSTTNGVSLLRVGGTFSAPSGSSITNSTGVDFSINGNGNANANVGVSYAGTITDTSGMLIQIQNVTASSTHTFSGAITDSGGTSTGISLTGNTGATVTFSGGLALSTGTNAAFTATGGGTVNVCDENPCNPAATGALINTLTTTTGTALNVANTSIGSNYLEFRRISANGASSGIILNNTGNGGLKVSGNGSTCNSALSCTGGAIQNTTGAGVSLTNAKNVSLTRMYISGTGSHGVSGTGMSDGSSGVRQTFAFLNGFMESPGDGDNESAFYFDTLGVDNILGTLTITDTTIQNFEDVGIHVGNQSGTLTVNVTNVTINNNSDTNGEEGIDISAEGTSTINANISNSRFQDLEGGSMNIISQGSGTIDLNVDSIVDIGAGGPDNFPTPPAMTFSAEGTSSNFFFDITNNKILDASGDGIFIGHEGEISGRITGNIITGIILGDGIRLDTDATGNQTTTFLIQNNQIGTLYNFETVNYSGIGDDGIQILDRDGTKTMNLTIDNNQIANTASEAIRHFADDDVVGGGPTNNLAITGNTLTNIGVADVIVITSQDAGVDVCANISGNNLSGTANKNIFLQQSLSATLRIPPASVAAMAAANTSATSSSLGTINTGVNCTVPAPTNAMLPNSSSAMVLGSTTQSSSALTSTIVSSEKSEPIASVDSSASIGGGKSVFRPLPTPDQSGETVGPITIGTLPAGKSVTIRFRVTVNNPTTVGAARILNQGSLSGSNFSNVSTTDPSPNSDAACSGTSPQTCTAIDRLDASVQSINRSNNSPTNTSSVSWLVTFDTAVSGLTNNNFTLVNTGLGGSPAITDVAPMGAAPATQWTVTASTGTGQGTLGLNMTNDTGLSHDVMNVAVTGQVYDIDKIAPTTVSFTRQNPPASLTNADVLVFRVTFSEAIGGVGGTIGIDDLIVTGTTATVSNIAFVSAGVYDVEVSGGDLASFNGTIGLNFSPGMVIRDLAGNDVANSEPPTDETYTADNGAPYVTLSSATSSSTNANPIPVIAQFSEVVSGFTATDIVAGNATVSNFIAVDGDTYTFDLTPSGQGLVTADITAGVAVDVIGNGNTAAAQFSRTFDSQAPSVTIISPASDPTNSSPIPVTVQFSENMIGFTAADITANNATVDNFVAVDGDTYTLNLIPSSEGVATVDIAASVAQDGSGNGNSSASQFSRTFDTLAPSVTINQASGQADPTSISPINFTVVFSEAVTGFGTGDVDLSTSTATGTLIGIVSGGPTTYNVAVSGMTGDGKVIASIPAGVATEGTNGNAASTSTDNMVMYDTTHPTVTINQASGQSDSTNASPINFTVVFSEAVTGFSTGDVTLSGTAGAATGTIIEIAPNDGTTYNVTVSGMTSDGTVIASVSAGAATDVTGNSNVASTSTDNTVVYDTTDPTVTINQAAGQADPTGASSVNFTVVFSEAVTGFSTGDVTLGGTANPATAVVTGSSSTYTVAVSGMTNSGTVIASVPAGVAQDSATNINTLSTSIDNTVSYVLDNTSPTVVSVLRADSNPTSAASVNFTVTFSEPVSGVDVNDFSLTTSGISNASMSVVNGSGAVYTVTVNTGNNSGSLRLNVINNSTIKDAALNALAAAFNGETYTINDTSAIFADVPSTHWAGSFIERLYSTGITAGCGVNPLIYCPDSKVTRAQMAIFLLRATHGSSYVPPAATGTIFRDVPITYWAAAWIEQFYAEGFTGGCGNGIYCPDAVLTTRAQMAIFLLRGKYGSDYMPPAASGIFNDVPATYWAAPWIEQLYAEGITGGCGNNNYCPEDSLTRAQMAVFLIRAFNLP